MAIGSADDDVGPLISWMETEPPGGRFRAYLASRASIRSEVDGPTLLVVVVPPLDVEEGAGRFLFTVAMVDVLIFWFFGSDISSSDGGESDKFPDTFERIGHTSDICPINRTFSFFGEFDFISNHSNIQQETSQELRSKKQLHPAHEKTSSYYCNDEIIPGCLSLACRHHPDGKGFIGGIIPSSPR